MRNFHEQNRKKLRIYCDWRPVVANQTQDWFSHCCRQQRGCAKYAKQPTGGCINSFIRQKFFKINLIIASLANNLDISGEHVRCCWPLGTSSTSARLLRHFVTSLDCSSFHKMFSCTVFCDLILRSRAHDILMTSGQNFLVMFLGVSHLIMCKGIP